jgi:Ankyrin repeats (3 copies)
MFPNPQAALPLPASPNLEQYKKRAKDLVKACRGGDRLAIRAWAVEWVDALRHQEAGRSADDVAAYAASRLQRDDESCSLAEAQFVIARSHGFASWPKFAAHLESLARADSPLSAFERAADAIVAGDALTLRRLLDRHPGLARARSSREHNATLLIYTSANGVEGYRQKSPANAAAIADMLLEAGAEVDATADVYFSRCTTLGLVATSTPPEIAGVQRPVIDVLLKHGARMDLPGVAGHGGLIRACLANGQPRAAHYLAERGAPLDLAGAAGIGRLDVVRSFFDEEGCLRDATQEQLLDAFGWACAYGRAPVVEFLIDRGVDLEVSLNVEGTGHTGLHVAASWGHPEAVDVLLRRGARVDAIDATWNSTPLTWTISGWSHDRPAGRDAYYAVVERLVRAGATASPDVLDSPGVRSDPRMRAALMRKS